MPRAIAILLAEAAQPKRDDTNQQLLINGMLMVAALLVGAALIAWAQRWRKRMTEESATTDSLGSFRASYEAGELTEEEYRRILSRMGGAKSKSLARPEQTPAPADSPQSEPRTPESPNAE